MVELFGNWTVCDEKGSLTKADADAPEAFYRKGIFAETPEQVIEMIRIVKGKENGRDEIISCR